MKLARQAPCINSTGGGRRQTAGGAPRGFHGRLGARRVAALAAAALALALVAAAPLAPGEGDWTAAAWHLPAAHAQQPADAPRVLNVTSAPTFGAYGPGAAFNITVVFDGPVLVEGRPEMRLNSGGVAVYLSGNGTADLLFNYTVRHGERADDLGYAGGRALSAGGGITNMSSGTAAVLDLPARGSPESLSGSGDVLVDYAVPALIASDSVDRVLDGLAVRSIAGIDAFVLGNRTYLVASGSHIPSAVQVFRVHDNGTLQAGGSSAADIRAAYDVDAFRIGNDTFAIAPSFGDASVRLFRVHDDGTLQANGSAMNGGAFSLTSSLNVDTIETSGGVYAVVGTSVNGIVQVIRVHGNGAMTAGAGMSADVSNEVSREIDTDAFEAGNANYVMVAGAGDGNVVRLFRLNDDGTLQANGSATNGTDGFDAISGSYGIAAFDMDGGAYALVNTAGDNGTQLIRVHNNGTMEAADSAFNGADGFDGLGGATGVSTFSAGGDPYAVVASNGGDAAQLIRIRGDGKLLQAGSAFDGMGGFDELDGAYSVVAFEAAGRAYAAVASRDVWFNPGDDGIQLIRLSPAAATGVSTSAASGTHGTGAKIPIEVAFDERVNVTGRLGLRLNSGGSAAYESGSGSDTLVFLYTVGPGEGAAALDYAGIHAITGPGVITEAETGVAANATLPPPGSPGSLSGSAAIEVVDPAPRVLSVTTPNATGAYRAGTAIAVNVTFSEDVHVAGTPRIALDTGRAGAYATYDRGNGTASLLFRYVVAAGDATDGLEHGGASALSLNGGSIRDVAGNAAELALPLPGSGYSLGDTSGIALDTAPPEIDRVSSPNASRAYGPGDRIDIRVAFDEAVEVDAARGAPVLLLETGRAGAHATYQTGSGTQVLLFRYVVAPVDESDDLGYAGRSALSLNGGTIKDDAGNPASLALPVPGTADSLSGSAAISVDHVEPPLIASDSVDRDDYGGLPLDMAQGADAFTMGNATYVIAASPQDNAVQLLRVHGNGTLSPAGNATDGGRLLLGGAADVAALRLGNETFAIVAAGTEPAVQLLRVHDNGTLSPAGNATDGGDFRLGAPSGVDAFVTGDGRAYAVVASLTANEIQVVRIHGNNGTLSAGPGMSATVAGTGLGAWYADAFAVGDRAYALVTATHDYDGVQLFRVHDDGRLGANMSATDGAGGFDALNGSRGVDVFRMGNDTYAIVVSQHDGGGAAQLIRVHYHGTLEAVHSAFNGTGGFDALGGAYGVSVFNGTFGDPYAVVTSEAGDAVQLVHIHDDGTLLPAGSAADGMPGPGGKIFDTLDEPQDVASFYLDGRAYAAVASRSDSGVQLIRLSPASATGASTSPAGGAHGLGAELAIEVAFDGRVNVTGRPELPLNSGGVAVYQSGNNSRTLEFLYTVAPGDNATALDYHEDEYALYGPGEIVEAETGVDADRTLPVPGSPGSLSGSSAIKIDGIAPRAASVTSATLDGAYGAGRIVNVSVAFTEPVSYRGAAPSLLLDAGGVVPATAAYASGNGTETLVFAYTVRPGDMSDDLAYWNTTALSGPIVDAVGNAANLTLPAPGGPGSLSGSSAIIIDGIAPRAVGVSSATPDGAYGAGRTIEVAVSFTETVSYSGTAPSLDMNVSGAARAVAYASGNATDRLVFAYTVRTGDMSGDLAYWNASALSGGLADAAGNAANLALPAPGGPGSLSGSAAIIIDGIAPRVASVTLATPDGEYGAGERIEIAVAFTETVSYSGAAPELLLNVSGAPAPAAYASGSGTAALSFAYTVRPGDMSDGLAYWNAAALSGPIADAAGNAADLALPEPGSPGSLSASSSASVDGSAPAAATADAAFTGPNTVRIEYSAPLGPPAGHAGPVYGTITTGDNARATPETGGVSGLGTAVHTVQFGGAGVDADQSGAIELGVALEGREGAARYAFPAGAIPVRAGADAQTLAPSGAMPVVAIERDGFVRAVNATGAGEAARPAIDVSDLSNATLLADASRNTVQFPEVAVNLTASFAEVMIPPNATAMSVPADGLLDLYVSAQGPTEMQVADALGASAGAVGSLMVVEVGDNVTHITFSLPVRILLVGQANGTAFYVNNTDRTVVPILAMCSEDDTAAVHERLNGTGIDECWLDSGADKVIHTYHLTLFGTAMAPGGGQPFVPACSIELGPQTRQPQPPPIEFGGVREGGESAAMDQEVRNTGTLPLAEVTIRATAWKYASGSEAMPANATSVMAGEPRGWIALDGEVDLPANADGATAKFRVEVPAGTLPAGAPSTGVAASQTVTYTAACGAP